MSHTTWARRVTVAASTLLITGAITLPPAAAAGPAPPTNAAIAAQQTALTRTAAPCIVNYGQATTGRNLGGNPTRYQFDGSPYLGAVYDSCGDSVRLYFGTDGLVSHYNLLVWGGRQREITAHSTSSVLTLDASKEFPGGGQNAPFEIQSCQKVPLLFSTSSCTRWSPKVWVAIRYEPNRPKPLASAPVPPAPPRPTRALGRAGGVGSPVTGAYTCADDNAGEVLPGDTITCALTLTTTRKVSITAADLDLPASTLYVSGTGSPESVTPRFDGTKARFAVPNLDVGSPRTVSMKLKVKKDTPDETALISKAELRDLVPASAGSTRHSNQLVTSTVPAKPGPAPGGKPGQPPWHHGQPAPKELLKAIEGVSFSIAPGDRQDFSASSLATRTGGKPKDLRFRGDCIGQKNGTVAVRNNGRSTAYKNNGAKGEETLTCEIVDRGEHNATRVQSRVTIKVE